MDACRPDPHLACLSEAPVTFAVSSLPYPVDSPDCPRHWRHPHCFDIDREDSFQDLAEDVMVWDVTVPNVWASTAFCFKFAVLLQHHDVAFMRFLGCLNCSNCSNCAAMLHIGWRWWQWPSKEFCQSQEQHYQDIRQFTVFIVVIACFAAQVTSSILIQYYW